MACGKYGRLFTEAEMGRAAISAATRALGLPIERSPDGKLLAVVTEAGDAALDAVNEIAAEATFPADEPLFLLRGQDAAAPRAIADTVDGEADYLRCAQAWGAGRQYVRAVERAADQMRAWQAANPDRVKVPD